MQHPSLGRPVATCPYRARGDRVHLRTVSVASVAYQAPWNVEYRAPGAPAQRSSTELLTSTFARQRGLCTVGGAGRHIKATAAPRVQHCRDAVPLLPREALVLPRE